MSDVLRMGYVHARVTDLARAKDHYANTLGLYPTLEEDGKLYFKGWDEWDHHSVVLEEGGVGAVKFGFKVWGADALDGIEKRAQQFGDCTVTRMSAGDNREVSDGVRVHLPCIDHTFEFYHSMTEVGLEVGTHNPDAFPRHLVGVGAPMLDHALLMGEDIDTAARFFMEVTDFYTTERAQTDLSDEHQTIASAVPDGIGEHAAEPRDRVLAPLLIGVHDDFGVAVGSEPMTALLQLDAQRREVVDFPVEADPHGAVLIRQRLRPGRQIDDAQAPVPESDAGADKEALTIRAAVRDRASHPLERRAVDGIAWVAMQLPGNAAHVRPPLPVPWRHGRRAGDAAP